MTDPVYPAARAVAATMERYFRRYLEAEGQGDRADLVPDAEAIERIVDAAFWASLRREEGYVPHISLAFLRPDQTVSPLMFERPLTLGAAALAKLAPAVERPGIHLGVARENGELRVWGATRTIPTFALVLEVVDPGVLVVKHRRIEAAKFVNVLVLEGDQIRDRRRTRLNLARLSARPHVLAGVSPSGVATRRSERPRRARGVDARASVAAARCSSCRQAAMCGGNPSSSRWPIRSCRSSRNSRI